MMPRLISSTSSADFNGCGTGYAACVIPTAGAACRCSAIVAGFFSISDANAAISLGIVALKKSVCRLPGMCRRMRLMSGRNPMSSMRSASSSTRYSSPLSFA